MSGIFDIPNINSYGEFDSSDYTEPAEALTAVIMSQVFDGQDYVVSGNFTGAITSGLGSLSPASPANGATAKGPIAITLDSGIFSVRFPDLLPGRYLKPILSLTGGGLTIVASSGQAFNLNGITGSPQFPEPGSQVDEEPPRMMGEISLSNITASGFHFSFPAATDNVGVTEYFYTLNGGAAVSLGLVREGSVSSLIPEILYTFAAYAVDAEGNESAPISVSISLEADTYLGTASGFCTVKAIPEIASRRPPDTDFQLAAPTSQPLTNTLTSYLEDA